MTVSGTSQMSDFVHAAYDKDYLNAWNAKACFMKFPKWRGDLKQTPGSTVSFPVNDRLARVTGNLTETSDVTAVGATGSEVSVTIVEKGNAVQPTLKLEETSYAANGKMIAGQVAENMINSLDYYVRGLIHANTLPFYGGSATSRVTCDITSDIPTLDSVSQLVEHARGMEIPPFADGSYAAVVHPAGIYELKKISEIETLASYSDPGLIYNGESDLLPNEMFPGEVFKINGLRIIRHPWGKVYLGAGTADHAATTLDGAHDAGATTVDVTSSAGWAVGEYVTIGTLESGSTQQPGTEQCKITAINTNALTITGAGNSHDNWGLKFAHDSGVSVIVSDNVFAIPVLGAESVVGYYDSETGREGTQDMQKHITVVPNRFWNYSWYWLGGCAIVDKYVIRGEFATAMRLLGTP